MGGCFSFAVHAGSTATFDGVTTVVHSGSVGTWPGTSITGAYKLENGYAYSATALAAQCASDRQSAYNTLSAMTCTTSISTGVLYGLTLTSGVFCSDTGTFSTVGSGILTLDGKYDSTSRWVFLAASTVITGGYSSVVFVNGGLGKNVYWRVGSSATIGLSSTFVGTILAYA